MSEMRFCPHCGLPLDESDVLRFRILPRVVNVEWTRK